MKHTMYKRFTESVAWNAFESIVYHFILLTHQIILFHYTSYITYGHIGSLFAITYLVVTFINMGLDVSLAPFLSTFSRSKISFWQFIRHQILPNYVLYASLLIIVFVARRYFIYNATWLLGHDWYLLCIICSIIATESIKKTTKIVLQLAFAFRVTVYGELASIVSYIILVWGGYWFGYSLDVGLIFTTMLIVASMEMVWFLFNLHRWYKTLPSTIDNVPSISRRIYKNRLLNYLNQLSKLIISGNFLVPFFASIFGFEYAGILKLATNITHSITIVLEKIFVTTSNVLFANVKHAHISIKRKVFYFVTNRTSYILYSCLAFFFVNYLILMQLSSLPHIVWLLMYGYFLIHFCESFFITYEQWCINEERPLYLLAINIINMVSFICITLWVTSPFSILVSILCIRLISFALLYHVSATAWRLRSSPYFHPHYLFVSVMTSLIIFVILHAR